MHDVTDYMLGEFQNRIKIAYWVISSSYMIKEVEKFVLCVYGMIIHSGITGNVGRILEKLSIVFSQHSLCALSHHKA